jgi:hypothetical protein
MTCLRFPPRVLLGFAWSMLLAADGLAAVGQGDRRIEFNRDIRPILSDNCFNCHGADSGARKARLRLDVRDEALRGGKSGLPAIVPGKPDDSELVLRVTAPHDSEDRMPTSDSNKPPLAAGDVAKLRAWIAQGADYQPHWAFVVPEKRPAPRAAKGTHPIDAFVHARLAQEKIVPAPRADAATLARRLHLDLTGLPPTPAEVAAFSESAIRNPKSAIEALVDRLLARETYGEKWAQPWLDVARYSDSNGFEKDLPREQWAWRDWVINAINRDLPYDRFIVEQIAGDLLPNATPEQIVATGFLRNSMTNEEGAIVPEQFRKEEIFDRMDCLGKAVLGLTLQCAQCHTHKFDPITHDDYYSLFAFLNNSYEAQSWVYTPAQRKELSELEAFIAGLESRVKETRPDWKTELAAWESGVRAAEIPWTTITATELGSASGLNHPTQEADGSILTLGHPSTRGSVYAIGEPELKGVTGLRLEALTHADLAFGGPGRSKYGTWAISELTVSVQTPGATAFQPLRLRNATADFSEPEGKLEAEWAAEFDKEKKRIRGPVAFLIDGKKETGWRADRGLGRRNQESVAVVEFECAADYPRGTKLKVELLYEHSGSDNGRHNTMLGRFRLGLTSTPAPRAAPIDYAAILAIATPAPQRTPAQQRAIFNAWRRSLPDAAALEAEIAAAWQRHPVASTSVLHLAERAPSDTRVTHLLDRGAWDRPKHAVAPRTPAALHAFPAGLKPDRLGLAQWMVDPRSPLTARVAVNRVWQTIFGAGLVETSEDFGTRAPVPEYLEVLDWLAVDFMAHGWSQKHLLRTILASEIYQRASLATPAQQERDPRNRLLARGPRFRLEAEALRDSALALAGLLTPKVGGPSIFPPVPQSVLDYNYVKPTYWKPAEGPERYRRALYVFRKRSMPDPVMGAFDAPNGDTACARRPRSNTPLAALTSLNEPVFVEAAQALALRILREGGADDAARADYAYRLCTARPIAPAEREKIATLLRTTRQRLAEGWLSARELATGDAAKLPDLPPGATPQDAAAWTVVARVLLNLDETLTKS